MFTSLSYQNGIVAYPRKLGETRYVATFGCYLFIAVSPFNRTYRSEAPSSPIPKTDEAMPVLIAVAAIARAVSSKIPLSNPESQKALTDAEHVYRENS